MATFHKFEDFVEQVGKGIHDFSSHTIKVYLSNEQPLVTDTIKANIADIDAEHGYSAGGASITPVWSETSGTATLSGTDIVWTASGGSFGPFQFAVLYNDSATSDNLIGWWDYGTAITITDGNTFTTDFGASILTLA